MEIIAAGAEGRLQYLEMDRGHLGTKNGIALSSHFFRKFYPLIGSGMDRSLLFADFPYMDCRNQGADTDSCGSQIVYLIDFQAGINLIRAVENITNLVSSNSIQTTAEGV